MTSKLACPSISKLKQKRQTDHQCKQAQLAVRLFYRIGKPDQPKQTDREIKLNHSGYYQGEKVNKPSDHPYQLTDPRKQTQTLHTVSEPQKNETQLSASNDKPTPPKTTGCSWVSVYERLETEIKLRHYSPKTLINRRKVLWLFEVRHRQFQLFIATNEPH